MHPTAKKLNQVLEQDLAALTKQARQHGLSMEWAAGHRLAANDFQAAKDSALLMTSGSVIGIIFLFAVVFASIRLLLMVTAVLLPALAAGIGLGLGGWGTTEHGGGGLCGHFSWAGSRSHHPCLCRLEAIFRHAESTFPRPQSHQTTGPQTAGGGHCLTPGATGIGGGNPHHFSGVYGFGLGA